MAILGLFLRENPVSSVRRRDLARAPRRGSVAGRGTGSAGGTEIRRGGRTAGLARARCGWLSSVAPRTLFWTLKIFFPDSGTPYRVLVSGVASSPLARCYLLGRGPSLGPALLSEDTAGTRVLVSGVASSPLARCYLLVRGPSLGPAAQSWDTAGTRVLVSGVASSPLARCYLLGRGPRSDPPPLRGYRRDEGLVSGVASSPLARCYLLVRGPSLGRPRMPRVPGWLARRWYNTHPGATCSVHGGPRSDPPPNRGIPPGRGCLSSPGWLARRWPGATCSDGDPRSDPPPNRGIPPGRGASYPGVASSPLARCYLLVRGPSLGPAAQSWDTAGTRVLVSGVASSPLARCYLLGRGPSLGPASSPRIPPGRGASSPGVASSPLARCYLLGRGPLARTRRPSWDTAGTRGLVSRGG